MAVSPTLLADEMTVALGFPLPASTELLGFATGLLNGLTGATATFGPPSGNTISGISGSSVASAIAAAAGYPGVSGPLAGFGSAFASYVQASAIVTYTGPGPSFFLGGTISGLNGSGLATAIQGAAGYASVSAQLLAMATAITSHITTNATVTSGVIS